MSYHEWLGPLLGSRSTSFFFPLSLLPFFPLGPSFFPKFMFVLSKFFPKGKKKNFLGRLRIAVPLDFISLAFCVLFFFPGLFFFFFFFFGKILVYELFYVLWYLLPTVPVPYSTSTLLRAQYLSDCLLYLNNNVV